MKQLMKASSNNNSEQLTLMEGKGHIKVNEIGMMVVGGGTCAPETANGRSYQSKTKFAVNPRD